MILNDKNTALLNEYKNACIAREKAIKELHEHLSLPVSNNVLIDELTEQMDMAHEKAEELQSKLDEANIHYSFLSEFD